MDRAKQYDERGRFGSVQRLLRARDESGRTVFDTIDDPFKLLKASQRLKTREENSRTVFETMDDPSRMLRAPQRHGLLEKALFKTTRARNDQLKNILSRLRLALDEATRNDGAILYDFDHPVTASIPGDVGHDEFFASLLTREGQQLTRAQGEYREWLHKRRKEIEEQYKATKRPLEPA
jgi:hypothetical protein